MKSERNVEKKHDAGIGIHEQSKIKYYALAILVAIFFFLFGLIVGFRGGEVPIASSPEVPSLTRCMSKTLAVLDLKQAPTPEVLRQLVEHCYSVVRSYELLKDFELRKLNFVQQYRANGILLWMVVIITISGVAIAAIQILASYRLAAPDRKIIAGRDELYLKRDQIVLKSSVTGLFILLLSFAFFLVFVLYVYRFERWQDDDLQKPQQSLNLPLGGLGTPKTGATK